MATETLDSTETETADAGFNFDALIDGAINTNEAALEDESSQTNTPPEKPVDPPKPDDAAKPDATKPADQTPPVETAPKPGSFKALKLEKDKEIADLRAAHAQELAEISGKASKFEGEVLTSAERAAAAEALRDAHEKELKQLQEKIVGDYEVPYSLDWDPEAIGPIAELKETEALLNRAMVQASTSLGSNTQAVQMIYQNRKVFADLMVSMARGMTPDAEHADRLMEGLQKIGVTVSAEDAREAVRGLKSTVPQIDRHNHISQKLNYLKSKNEPDWQNQQAARHEALRRETLKAADVSDDAAEGDDATMATILKANPERRTKLQAEADKLSAMVIGPAPGKVTAAAVRATPHIVRENAMKAARLPVALEAYRESAAENAGLKARVAELEARIASESAVIPKAGGTVTPASTPGKIDWDAEMAAALNTP